MAVGRTLKGVSWSAIERFSVQIVQFVVSMLLARLLTPEIYGVVALAMVILHILQTINEVGFGAALMQKLDRDEMDFSTVFVLNILLGITLYILLFFASPLLALITGYPELTNVTRWLGLNLIITSFIVVQRTRCFIQVDFKSIAKATLVASLLSGFIGVVCAYKGYGVMSLVVQSLLNNFITTLIIWIQARWTPKIQFSWSRFKYLFNFAYKLIAARLVNSIFAEIYHVVVGAIYSPAQLGLFNRAKSFETILSNNIVTIVQRVSAPIFCEQQNDHKKLGDTLLSFISKTSLIVYPLLSGLFVLADSLILVILTEKWMGAVWILQVLCFVGLFYVPSAFNKNIFNATGRTDWALKSEIIIKILSVIIIALAVLLGFEALIWSQVVIAFIDYIVCIYYTHKQVGLSYTKQIISLLPTFLTALVMGIVVFIVTSFFDDCLFKLVVGVAVGVVSYIIICFMFNIANFRNLLSKVLR